MKKRVNLSWRIVVALLLLFAPALMVVLSWPAQASAPPDTSIDSIPGYVGPAAPLTAINGTSLADAGRTVENVQVQISYVEGTTTLYWDDSTSTWDDEEAWNDADTLGTGVWGDQKDWGFDATGLAADLKETEVYTVKARAIDDLVAVDATPASRTFRYDETKPGVTEITTPASGTVTSITQISGKATDTGGVLATVWVRISENADGTGAYDAGNDSCWNGTIWSIGDVWVRATSTTSWYIKSTTTPPLPNWTHNATYNVSAKAVDKAGFEETGPFVNKSFTFRKDLGTGLYVYMDTIPTYVNALGNISGTSKAATANITMVKVQIKRGVYYWNGSAIAWEIDDTVWNNASAVDGNWDDNNVEDWVINTSTAPRLPKPADGADYWQDGKEYTVTAKALEGTTPSTTVTYTFTYDETAPAVTAIDSFSVTTILGETVFNQLTSITGDAADTSPGALDSVWVQITDGTNYWNGAVWNASETWLRATGTTAWTLTTTTTAWKNGESYNVSARAVDQAGNMESTITKSFIFVVDLTLPTPTPTPTPTATPTPAVTPTPPPTPTPTPTPVAGAPTVTIDNIESEVSAVPEITGDATAASGRAIETVEVRIRRAIDTTYRYWTGSAWTTTADTWIDAEATDGTFDERTEGWEIAAADLPDEDDMTDLATYRIEAKAQDDEDVWGSVDTETFTYVVGGPETTIDDIEAEVNEVPEITGDATAVSGRDIETVEVRIRRAVDTTYRYWTGSTWTSTSNTWIDAEATDGTFDERIEAWEIAAADLPDEDDMDDGATYRIEAKAQDDEDEWGDEAETTFIYDITEPSTTIDEIEETVTTLTSITGTAEDPPPTLAGVEVQIQRDSDDKYWDGSSWQTSSTWNDAIATDGTFDEDEEDWKYTDMPEWEDGVTYTVKARAMDAAGNVDATPATESFTYEEAEGFALEWWHSLLIALGALIVIAGIILILVLPKKAPTPEVPEEGYEEEEF